MPRRPVKARAPRAFSYTRFSSPAQAAGGSYRRQLERAEAHAAKLGIPLDRKLKLHDKAISAFRGANLRGALGRFLEATRAGDVRTGDVLILENIDRLSRQGAWDALPTLQEVINAGVEVHTLYPERVYTADKLRTDPMALFELTFSLHRAAEESRRKSDLSLANWRAKRQRAAESGTAMTSWLPGWLRLDGDNIVAIPERAALVRSWFERTLAGESGLTLIAELNAANVPTWTSVNRKPAKRWQRSYISKVLRDRAVLGECQTGDTVIPSYFPRIIEPEMFEQVQALLDKRPPATPKGISWMFAGLAWCECGASVHRHNPGRGSPPTIRCTANCEASQDPDRTSTRTATPHVIVHVDEIEAAFRAAAPELLDLAGSFAGSDALRDTAGALESLLSEHQQAIEALVERLTHTDSPALLSRLRDEEARAHEVRSDLDEVYREIEEGSSALVSKRLADLRALLDDGRAHPAALNAAMRAVVERAVVYWRDCEIVIHWRHGGTGRFYWVVGAMFTLET